MKKLIIFFLFPLILNAQGWVGNLSYLPSFTPAFPSLSLNYSTRVDNLLIDVLNNDTAIILNPAQSSYYSGDQVYGVKTRPEEHVFDGNNYTIFFKTTLLQQLTAGSNAILSMGGGTAIRGMYMYSIGATLRLIASDGTTTVTHTLGNSNTLILPYNYVEVYINVDAVSDSVKVKLIADGETIVYDSGFSTSTFIKNTNDNSSYWSISSNKFAVSGLKKYNRIASIDTCRLYSDTTNLQFYLPYPFCGVDVSKNQLHWLLSSTAVSKENRMYVNQNNMYGLEMGYAVYKPFATGNTALYWIPYNQDGTHMEFQNYTSVTQHYREGYSTLGKVNHNLFDSKIAFADSYFDKSDTNIWNNSKFNALYYDTLNYKAWHVSELDQRYIANNSLDTNNRMFIKIKSRNYLGDYYSSIEDTLSISPYYKRELENIYLTANNLSGSLEETILTANGDIRAVSGTDVYNKKTFGTLQTDTAMLVIRFDDAFEDLYFFKAMMDSFGVVGIFNFRIFYSQFDSAGFLDYAQIKDFISNGWEATTTALYDDNLSDSSKTYIDYSIPLTYSMPLDSGILVRNFTPNQYGGENQYVRKVVMDYYHSCHVGYTIAAEEATNPPMILLDNLQALRGDIAGSFLWYEPAGVQATKDQIDIAKSTNSLLITYAHNWTPQKQAGLKEIIQYAQSQGLLITTLEDALTNHTIYK